MRSDYLQKFLIDDLNIRGEYIQLKQSLADVDANHHYPTIIRHYISELSLATVLLTALVKLKGTITLELNVNASIEWIVCKCNESLEFRSLARWDDTALAGDFERDFKNATLVVTIQTDNTTKPYQAVVPLNSLSIIDAIEVYFAQSEQLDTKIRIEKDNNTETYTAILLQKLPEDNSDDVNWATAIMGLLKCDKDVITATKPTELLPVMFSENNVIAYPAHEVSFKCTCTLEKMQNAVKMMDRAEIDDILKTHKKIEVKCEFCNNQYDFGLAEIRSIFGNDSNA